MWATSNYWNVCPNRVLFAMLEFSLLFRSVLRAAQYMIPILLRDTSDLFFFFLCVCLVI